MRHPTHLHSGGIDWPKVRVLVYSQDEAFRFLVRQTFRKLNVGAVLAAATPAEVPPLMDQVPAIALVDTSGPLEAALAALRQMRAADAALPVLLVARAAERGHLQPAHALGIDGVVPKPVSGHELVSRVGDSLKLPTRSPPAADPPATTAVATASTGGGTYGEGAAPAAGKRGGGRYADDDGPVAAKPAAGTYGDDTATDPPAAAPCGRLEALGDGRATTAEAEAARARWLAELAEAGHQGRSGKDVAGLDLDAIVAAHTQWLASQGGDGRRADFRKMDLAGAGLAGTVLANANFRDADLSDAQLAEARLDGADFRHATLGAADLSAANLGVAQLRHCDLRLANLQGASLRGADLSGARLRGAKLDGADLKGAILVGCDLGEADLSKVDNLVQTQVDKAVCDMKTKLPPGLARPDPR